MPNQQKKILVIDSEPEVNDVIRTLLEIEGHHAVAAKNLDSAVDLLSSVKFDLVISDYMEIQYKRGEHWPILEMFQRLVEPGTPIIVLTASVEAAQQGAQRLGIAQIVPKPFEARDLLRIVAEVIAAS